VSNCLWQEDIGPLGDIRHISTEHHIELICIKIETVMSEYERAAETDVFRKGETAHKIHKKTRTTCRLQLAIGCAAILPLHSILTACKYV